jgi:uncharacterized protein (DUF58 family)
MLTSRGWWYLFFAFLALAAGYLLDSRPLTVIALALIVWFGAAWFLFAMRVPLSVRRLRLEREVCDDRGPTNTLWAGRSFGVRVRLVAGGVLRLPYLRATDRPPYGVEVEGATSAAGPVGYGEVLAIAYRIRCPAPGPARFEGFRVQIADLQGFFYHTAFVHQPVVLRVMPPLIQVRNPTPSLKRDNLLPPPGVHRLRRPGAGGELLDLRDYMPGDPPKTIAWKVSARRDRLITKEFEREAPVRCTLFVDASQSVRVPTVFGKSLGRLVEIAGGVAQANADARDLTGLVLFDEQGAAVTPPDRSPAHGIQLLQTLADASALAPASTPLNPDRLTPLAYAFAQEVYPHLLRSGVNLMPFWVEWFAPFPANSRPPFSLLRFLNKHKLTIYFLGTWVAPLPMLCFMAYVFFSFVLVGRISLSAFVAAFFTPSTYFFWINIGTAIISLAALLVLLGTLIASGRLRRQSRFRKPLAAIFSVKFGLGPGGLAALLEDDDQFGLYTQRFLADHQVPYTAPLYDRRGRYLFAAPEKAPVLATALTRAVGKGRDNELFVLLADLLELEEGELAPLVKAVRMAIGRRHQVMLVIPWPANMRPPDEEPPAPLNLPPDAMPWALRRATTRRYQQAFHRVRRTFARLGVQVVCAEGDEPLPLILQRIDRLRAAGVRR